MEACPLPLSQCCMHMPPASSYSIRLTCCHCPLPPCIAEWAGCSDLTDCPTTPRADPPPDQLLHV